MEQELKYMKSTLTVKVSGTLTNDAWGAESHGTLNHVVYVADDDNLVHDVREILAKFRDKKVEITISEI
jgi:hypothetical protein